MAAASLLQANHDEADPTLCRRCEAFDIQAFSRNKVPWRGYLVGDIVDSAQSGCPFCSYLARCLDDHGFPIYIKKQDERGRFSKQRWVHFTVLRAVQGTDNQFGRDGTRLNITHLQVYAGNGAPYGFGGEPPLLEFHVVADPDDPASTSGDVVGRYVNRSTKPQESVEVIKTWLATCDGHVRCSKTLSGQPIVTPTLLPTRCLEVTADTTAVGGIYIRLVETARTTGEYTTLSHRWPAPPKDLQGATTSANLANRLAGKEALESSLPRHFIDACVLTLRLGYRYIWIDAVCIIQGKGEPLARVDWIHEAAQMASYYQNSRLTIAATYSNDTTGLFNAETPEVSRLLIRLPYRAKTSSIASPPNFFYLIPTERILNVDYDHHVTHSDLLARGWVVQEWVLSRRILCYTPTNAYFQCMEEFPYSEDGKVITVKTYKEGQGGRPEPFVKRFDRDYSSDLELKNMDLSRQGFNIYNIWLNLVEAYSKRHLTRPETDKLMGLVSIAKEFSRALEDQLDSTVKHKLIWVGGMWFANICEDLLWEQIDHSPTSILNRSLDCHDAGRIAEVPSWSWASRRSAVQWSSDHQYGGKYLSFCEVKAVRDAKAQYHEGMEAAGSMTLETAVCEDWESVYTVGGDPTKRFPVLCIRGLLTSILIRESFTDEAERQTASELSGRIVASDYYIYDLQRKWEAGLETYSWSYHGRGRLRKAALLSSEGRICGWVSLDKEQSKRQANASREPWNDSGLSRHGSNQVVTNNDEAAGTAWVKIPAELPTSNLTTAGQQQTVPEQGNGNDNNLGDQEHEIGRQNAMEQEHLNRETQVLLVSRKTADGGVALGYMNPQHPVYNILCLRRYTANLAATENSFERIGVGTLFGRDVQRLFENTRPQDIELF